jgi:hypothetical protein
MEKSSIASCGWYMERLKRFSAHSLRPMSGRSVPLTCARIAPVPGRHVCVAYERRVSHESDSRHSGHAPALRQAVPKSRSGFLSGAGVPHRLGRPVLWRVPSETFCGAVARDPRIAAGRQVLGVPDMARQHFLAPCMVIGSVRHDTGVWRTRCRTTGTEGKGRCVGQERQGDGGSPGEVAVPAREPRLSRCESLVDARDLLLATIRNLIGTQSNIFRFVTT